MCRNGQRHVTFVIIILFGGFQMNLISAEFIINTVDKNVK